VPFQLFFFMRHITYTCRLAGGRRSGTRSAGRQMLEVTRCNTSFGDRSFAAAAPQVWNNLPDSVRDFTLCENTVFAKRPKSRAPCGLRSCKNRPAPFPGRMSYKATKTRSSFCFVSYHALIVLLLIRAPFYVLLIFVGMCSVFWLF